MAFLPLLRFLFFLEYYKYWYEPPRIPDGPKGYGAGEWLLEQSRWYAWLFLVSEPLINECRLPNPEKVRVVYARIDRLAMIVVVWTIIVLRNLTLNHLAWTELGVIAVYILNIVIVGFGDLAMRADCRGSPLLAHI